jgi:Protein of unknown function (DUF3105)
MVPRRSRASVLLLVAAVLSGVLVVGVAAYSFVTRDVQAPAVAAISADEAVCGEVVTRPAEGQNQHVLFDRTIHYPVSPPAFGPHWPGYLEGPEIRSFYAVEDRPPLPKLVHSLEHGYTILWYDDDADVEAVRALADSYPVGERFIAAPWTGADGDPFPTGHVALTHWTGPDDPTGVWTYCDAPSTDVVETFREAYTATNAPEPGAP